MSELLHGGKADNVPSSAFPAKKLRDGMKVEREHTSNRKVTEEIAKDHLSEDMDYYEKLKKMEKKAQVDALFEELLGISAEITKISAPISWRGAAIGGALGSALAAPRIMSRELEERAADDRANLTDEAKKALRKKRLGGHLANVLAWGGTGALAGGMEHKAREAYNSAKDSAKRFVGNSLVSAHQAGQDLTDHAATTAHKAVQNFVQDTPGNLIIGTAKMPFRAAKFLINKIRH